MAATVTSRQRLSLYDGLGGEDQLADHPNYKYGRPGGCSFCMEVSVSYTQQEDAQTVLRLSSFNLSCLTPYHTCRTVEELLPAAKDWHVYDDEEAAPPASAPFSCLPAWVLARDTRDIFVVDVLQPTNPSKAYSGGRLRVVEVLKSYRPLQVGTTVGFGDQINEHLISGRRYLLILPSSSEKEEKYFYAQGLPSYNFNVLQCNVYPDRPEVRAEVRKGLAQNDGLRVPEIGSW